MNDSTIPQLLSKYLQKTLNPQEFKLFRAWLNEVDEPTLRTCLEAQWEGLLPQTSIEAVEMERIFYDINQLTSTEIIANRLLPQANTRIRWALSIAAAIVFLVLTSLSAYLHADRQQFIELASSEVVIKTDKGQRTQVHLPDGSVVDLNSLSTLTYQQRFGKEDRQVNLSGEGYFQVKKDTKKKFIVSTKHLDIEVLGTSFNVNAYEGKSVFELALVEGSVLVSTHTLPVQTVLLSPNEKAVFDINKNALMVMSSDKNIEMAWVSKELVFRSEAIKNVLARIERRYGVTINHDIPNFGEDLYTGTFDNEELLDVLNILKTHYKFSYKIKQDDVWITR
ncbi:iron dicitrate transporter FecR [Bacteroidales bacterium]|nr:iron dicitrate transporter FecR [Bacteroidales bacterium]